MLDGILLAFQLLAAALILLLSSVVFRRKRAAATNAFLLMVFSYAGWTLFAALSRLFALCGLSPNGVGTLPGLSGSIAGFFSTSIGFCLLHFSIAFPDARLGSMIRTVMRLLAVTTVCLGLACFTPFWISERSLVGGTMFTKKEALFYVTSGWSFLLIFAGTITLAVRQSRETRPVYRTQMNYCLAAMFPAILSAFVFSFALPLADPKYQAYFAAGPAAGIAFTLILFVSIVRNRLFDIVTLIHRSILLLAIAAAGTIAAFLLTDFYIRRNYGVAILELGIAYFVIILCANFFFRHLQPAIESRFFGRIRKPQQLISRVLASVSLVDRDVFAACLEAAGTLRRELRLNRVLVIVPSSSAYRCDTASAESDAALQTRVLAQVNRHPRMFRTLAQFVARQSQDYAFETILPADASSMVDRTVRAVAAVRDFFAAAGFEAVFPILHGRQVMAVFVLGRKSTGGPYFSDEQAALRTLGEALAVSLKNLHDFNAVVRAVDAEAPQHGNPQVIALDENREISYVSAAIGRAVSASEKAAANTETVMLHGETGSGKDLFARLIHSRSGRRGSFVAVNCATLAESLLENELFGHEKGAYTGADRAAAGLFEQANGGTLFLDEIGEITPGLQAKLLRILEERKVRRIGGQTVQSIDVRIVTATHRDLRAMVSKGQFRADLFYRLNVVTIQIPPLRDRRDDIPILAERFLSRLRVRLSRPEIRLSLKAQQLLMRSVWPGNVRELQNSLTRAAVNCETDLLVPEDFEDTESANSSRGIDLRCRDFAGYWRVSGAFFGASGDSAASGRTCAITRKQSGGCAGSWDEPHNLLLQARFDSGR